MWDLRDTVLDTVAFKSAAKSVFAADLGDARAGAVRHRRAFGRGGRLVGQATRRNICYIIAATAHKDACQILRRYLLLITTDSAEIFAAVAHKNFYSYSYDSAHQPTEKLNLNQAETLVRASLTYLQKLSQNFRDVLGAVVSITTQHRDVLRHPMEPIPTDLLRVLNLLDDTFTTQLEHADAIEYACHVLSPVPHDPDLFESLMTFVAGDHPPQSKGVVLSSIGREGYREGAVSPLMNLDQQQIEGLLNACLGFMGCHPSTRAAPSP